MPSALSVRAGKLVVVLTLFFSSGLLWAQVFDEDDDVDGDVELVDGDIELVDASAVVADVSQNPAQAGAAATSAAQVDAERKARRLQIIRALSFDRRPSAILKAWREPPPKIEATPADAAANPPQAVPEPAPPARPIESAAVEKAAGEKVSGEKVAGQTAPAANAEQAQKDEAAKQAEAAKQQAEAAKRKAAEDAAFQQELSLVQRQVTLGEWSEVQKYIARLEREEADALYGQLLTSLQTGAMGRMNVDPNMLQQLVMQATDVSQIQQSLASMGMGAGGAYAEKNLFTMPDVLGLMLATPAGYDEDAGRKLGMILQLAITAGFDLQALLSAPPIEAARQGSRVVVSKDPEPPAIPESQVNTEKPANAEKAESLPRPAYAPTARDVARILCAARQETKAGEFLPKIDDASAAKDGAGLNLIARHVLARHATDKKLLGLEEAWKATQAVLEIPLPPEPPKAPVAAGQPANARALQNAQMMMAGEMQAQSAARPAGDENTPAGRYQIARGTREEALKRAVELAPKIRKELGRQWLDDSFQHRPERGKEILMAIGSATSGNLASHPQDSDYRKNGLELQKTAVNALLAVGENQIAQWDEPLTVAALAWLKEAQVTRDLDQGANARGWRRDRYGNYFMFDSEPYMQSQFMGRGQVRPINTEDVLELQPNETWLKHLGADLLPRFSETLARLQLKVEDERLAFPHIERLATTNPDRAKDLAEEFIRVWTKSHNPNEQRDGYNPFYYYYSYERRAERIPLTRSKQERNLKELAEWIRRLKGLPIGDLNETLLTGAFTAAHSKAEVYRLEAIESVFGSVDTLKPRTLAELIQQMRGNLAGVWRMPDTQRQNSTNRKQRDIRAEVLHGYEVAKKVTNDALQKHLDHWALLLAQAAILHDEIDYEKEAEKSSDFSERRSEAMNLFAAAAKAYVAAVPEIPLDEQTVLPFEMWFYASLGSVDLPRITADKVPDVRQPARIRETLLSLPEQSAEWHLSQFANNLFTRGTEAKPELKHRYLRAGFEVVGEHKLAREARKLLSYYADLVTEIKLETRIDGSDVVGHEKPFGVFVNLVHTKEIERESGGFGKYLQNQNNPNMYFYNFGRPLENYRDKFQEFAKKALSDHFEVISVTFQEASVNSRALPDYGWRMTPYAYLLLKAKGPEVDKLAPLRMDLDFLDTSGYAILPIESPALPVDAKSSPAARPVEELVVTQTLDERQSDKGKLILEVRATARGLAPDLSELLDIKPEGFEIASVDDRGLAVIEFDKDSPGNSVRSERQWTVALAATDAGKPSKAFQFGSAKLPVKELIYQRYEDADLKSVEAVVSLGETYRKPSYAAPAMIASAAALLVGVGLVFWRSLKTGQKAVAPRITRPEPLTPFTVIGFLRDLDAQSSFDDGARRELRETVDSIERHYFESPLPEPPDIARITDRWVARAAAH